MSFGKKVKELFVSHLASGLASGLIGGLVFIIFWIASKAGPVILPALEANLSKAFLVEIILGSLAINVILLICIWVISKSKALKLKYAICWDSNKNPHCPSCKKPIAGYSKYDAGMGYYCRPCGKLCPIQDSSGNDIDPKKASDEL